MYVWVFRFRATVASPALRGHTMLQLPPPNAWPHSLVSPQLLNDQAAAASSALGAVASNPQVVRALGLGTQFALACRVPFLSPPPTCQNHGRLSLLGLLASPLSAFAHVATAQPAHSPSRKQMQHYTTALT